MEELKGRIERLFVKVDVDAKRKRIRELEAESTHTAFWQDHQTAAKKMKELSTLQKEVEEMELLQLWLDEGEYKEAEKLLEKLEMFLFFSGRYDKSHAILGIHSG